MGGKNIRYLGFSCQTNEGVLKIGENADTNADERYSKQAMARLILPLKKSKCHIPINATSILYYKL